MPRVQFHRPVEVKAAGQRHAFPAGVHSVPEELLGHWYLQLVVQAGAARVLDDPEPAAPAPTPAPEPDTGDDEPGKAEDGGAPGSATDVAGQGANETETPSPGGVVASGTRTGGDTPKPTLVPTPTPAPQGYRPGKRR